MKNWGLGRLFIAAMMSLVMLPLFAAQEDSVPAPEDAKAIVHTQFDALFRSVTNQLTNNQEMYLSNPVAYYDFLTSTVINHWDSSSTTRALVGKSHYTNFSDQQRLSLIATVDQTLIRYAFEGLESYGGQDFRVADVVVNEKQGMGWVQVLMESPIIPDINLDILIKRTNANVWQAVDIRVKGITYVAIKKHKYREVLEEQGFNALMDNLTDKNTDFFEAICAGANSPELAGSAPC
ncbi:MAG: ABC transporter substrate-binding protein [Porticoccaceae bacterium]|nr:ABC transporter substrate-binding protein [Porticoccaceae bacterium]